MTRRRSLELLGAGIFMTTALGVGHAEDNFNTTPKVLFFSKSSSYEHECREQASSDGPAIADRATKATATGKKIMAITAESVIFGTHVVSLILTSVGLVQTIPDSGAAPNLAGGADGREIS